jgi:methionyl-tRNA synthetase
LRTRYRADLANDLGNLVNRTVSMAHRYRGGLLAFAASDPTADAAALAALGTGVARRFEEAMNSGYQVHLALEAVWELVAAANGFVESAAPWKLAKDPAQAARLDEVLVTLVEASRLAAALAHPVIPRAADELLTQLGFAGHLSDEWGAVAAGHRVGEALPVFPRLESESAA